jgi:hypothetical protein
LQHLVARVAGQGVGCGHAALLQYPPRLGLVTTGSLGQIGDAVVKLCLRYANRQAKRESEYCFVHLFWRQANRAVQADNFTVEHVVI